MRFLLWFLAGLTVAAIGWFVSANVGNEMAGIVVAVLIATAAAVGEFVAGVFLRRRRPGR